MPAGSASSPTRRGRPSREIADVLLEGLGNVVHRGATAADRRTGDGAGVLLPLAADDAGPGDGLPARRVVPRGARGRLPRGGDRAARVAAGPGRARRARCRRRARRCRGSSSCSSGGPDATTRSSPPSGLGGAPSAAAAGYVASLSFRTVTYKALCAADQLARLLPRSRRPGALRSLRDLPPALLDEHDARPGNARSRSGSSATTARSTRSRATSTGCAPARATSAPTTTSCCTR